jgi:hypothetical protein
MACAENGNALATRNPIRTSPDLKLIPAEHRFNGFLFVISLFSSFHPALESFARRLRAFIFHTND